MSVFANHFGSDIGKELFAELGNMGGDARTQFLSEAEATNPGISEEYNVKHSMENIGSTSVIKDFGSARGFTNEGLAGLSADIASAEKTLGDVEKGDIDEHLLSIEQLSGIELLGNEDYDSVFTYLKDAKNGFDTYQNARREQGISKKELDRVAKIWDESYNRLWPQSRAPESVGSMKSQQVVHSGPGGHVSKVRTKSNISQDLQDLVDLNEFIEDNSAYYEQQFIDPITGEQSDLAKSLYEESIK